MYGRFHRHLYRLTTDKDRLTAPQLDPVRPLQSQERSVQNQKCRSGKCREDRPLNALGLPEYGSVAERAKPERINIV